MKEDTIGLLREMHERCLMPTATDPKRYAKAEALETAMKALDNIQKYKWHDLRKNPEDLPEECGTYLVFTEYTVQTGVGDFDMDYRCIVAPFIHYRDGWHWSGDTADDLVIAWMPIPEFEEEK